MRVQNLHGLALSGFPLGVACTTCGHRALVAAAKVGARDGNMTEIRELRLRCTEAMAPRSRAQSSAPRTRSMISLPCCRRAVPGRGFEQLPPGFLSVTLWPPGPGRRLDTGQLYRTRFSSRRMSRFAAEAPSDRMRDLCFERAAQWRRLGRFLQERTT
jgi:hypothetical protein